MQESISIPLRLADLAKHVLTPRKKTLQDMTNKVFLERLMLGYWFHFPAIIWRTEAAKKYKFNDQLNSAMDLDFLIDMIINNEKFTLNDHLIDFLESNLPYLLNLVFLIFGIVSLNLKENLPRFFQFLVVALIYLFIVDIAVTMIIVLESDLEKYLPLYHRYFSRLPTGITHFVFIISALMMLRKGVILAFPLFLADILNASTLLLPYLSSLANLTNTSAPIFNIYSSFCDYVCFSVQSIIMASSIVSRIKSMQDQLNLREKTHRELVENQNRVL
jgi:hypothetical protein